MLSRYTKNGGSRGIEIVMENAAITYQGVM